MTVRVLVTGSTVIVGGGITKRIKRINAKTGIIFFHIFSPPLIFCELVGIFVL